MKFNTKAFWSFAFFILLIGLTSCMSPVDEIIEEEMRRQELVGLAVGVVQNGEIVHLGGYGYADRENKVDVTTDTMFRWASISKTITAVVAMQLYEQNKIDLDKDITDYVPSFPAKSEGTITLAHLLSNQSGMRHYDNDNDNLDWNRDLDDYPFNGPYNVIASVDVFKDFSLLFKPGTDYRYSSFGFILAGAAIEAAAQDWDGIGYEEWVDRHIATPAGMTTLQADYEYAPAQNRAKGYEKDCYGEIVLVDEDDVSWKLPAGGFISTIVDLALFAKSLMNDTLVDPDIKMNEMWNPLSVVDSGDDINHGYGYNSYGYGFKISYPGDIPDMRVEHGGSQPKTRTNMVIYPHDNLAIVIMCNTHHADTTRIFRLLANEYGRSWDIDPYSLYDKLGCDDEDTCSNSSDLLNTGVWLAGETDQLIRKGYTYSGFYDEFIKLVEAGYLLKDLEVYTNTQGEQRWDGVFTKESGRYGLWRGFDFDGFRDKFDEMIADGLRLIDLETYIENGQRRWAGVFAEGSDAYAMWRGFTTEEFHDKWEEMQAQGLRLIDLETYIVDGQRRWAGVWRSGTEPYALWRNLTQSEFHDKWVELNAMNLRLIDIETYMDGSRRLWAGIWAQGTEDYALYRNYDHCGFLEEHETLQANGMALIDLETY